MTGRPRVAERLGASIDEWNARHPLTFHGRTCPACGHRDCFGALPGNASRWACFSADHGRSRCGLSGRTCWTGDALDLEAYRSGLSRLAVLRRDGFASSPYPPPPRPPRGEQLARRWLAVGPRRDARDLVRLDGEGRPWIRCYGATGAPCGLHRLDLPLPPGWIGATPEGAAFLVKGEPMAATTATPDELWRILVSAPADRPILVGQPADLRRVRVLVEPCDASPLLVEVCTVTPGHAGEEVADG